MQYVFSFGFPCVYEDSLQTKSILFNKRFCLNQLLSFSRQLMGKLCSVLDSVLGHFPYGNCPHFHTLLVPVLSPQEVVEEVLNLST